MSTEIIKVLDAITEKFGIVIDWTSENIIPYLKELCGKFITYEIVTSSVCIAIYIIVIIAALIFIKIVNKHEDWGVEHYVFHNDDNFGRWVIYIVTILVIVFMVILILPEIFDIVTCIAFPEKIFIEELYSIHSTMN